METLIRNANRGSVSTGPGWLENSCKFEADNTEYLSKTFSSAGNREIWTYSCWFKRTELSNSFVDAVFSSYVDGNNRLRINFYQNKFEIFGFTASVRISVRTNSVFTDTSAWYHIVVVSDTTQNTASNRVKSYINGQQITDFGAEEYPAQNSEPFINSNVAHYIGQRGDAQGYTNGYLAESHFIDGQVLAPTDFGEYDEDSGIWKPKAYTGSYGTNGFYLDFADASDLGDDESGNGNDFTANNITSADQATDTPINNFCTFNNNAAIPYNSTQYVYATEGETQTQKTSGSGWANNRGSIGIQSGKWYWEATRGGTSNTGFGIVPGSHLQTGSGNTQFSLLSNGRLYGAGTSPYLTDPPSFSFTDGDIVAIALDLDNQKAYLSKNGVWQNSADPANGTNPINLSINAGEFYFAWTCAYNNLSVMKFNFGGYTSAAISSGNSDANGYGTFEYAPPSGYYALCTKNLAEYG